MPTSKRKTDQGRGAKQERGQEMSRTHAATPKKREESAWSEEQRARPRYPARYSGAEGGFERDRFHGEEGEAQQSRAPRGSDRSVGSGGPEGESQSESTRRMRRGLTSTENEERREMARRGAHPLREQPGAEESERGVRDLRRSPARSFR